MRNQELISVLQLRRCVYQTLLKWLSTRIDLQDRSEIRKRVDFQGFDYLRGEDILREQRSYLCISILGIILNQYTVF